MPAFMASRCTDCQPRSRRRGHLTSAPADQLQLQSPWRDKVHQRLTGVRAGRHHDRGTDHGDAFASQPLAGMRYIVRGELNRFVAVIRSMPRGGRVVRCMIIEQLDNRPGVTEQQP